MGVGGSNLLGSLSLTERIKSEKELLLKTDDISKMADSLFKFMFTRQEENEIWEIIDKPEDYIIALSTMIEKQFRVIGFTTKEGKPGEIYFLRMKKGAGSGSDADSGCQPEYKTPAGMSPQEATGYRSTQLKDHSKIIAFFYVRIFQILGSLLFIIKDIKLNNNVPRTSNLIRPYTQYPDVPRFVQSGGGLSTDKPIGPYEFLRRYLTPVTPEMMNRFSYLRGKTNIYSLATNLFFEFNKPDTITTYDINNTDSLTEAGKFILSSSSGEKVIKIRIANTHKITSVSSVPLDNLSGLEDAQLTALAYNSLILVLKYAPTGGARPTSAANEITLRIRSSTPNQEIVPSNVKSGLKYEFYASNDSPEVNFILQSFGSKGVTDEAFKQIIESAALFAVLKIDNTVKFAVSPEKAEKAANKVSKVGEAINPDKIKIRTIKEIYTKLKIGEKAADGKITMYEPHCIARAKQLLDPFSIEGTRLETKEFKEAYGEFPTTDICKFTAPDIKEDKSLADYIPTKIFAQLWGKIDGIDESQHKPIEEYIKILEAFVGSSSGGESSTKPLDMKELEKQKGEQNSLKDALATLSKAFKSDNTTAAAATATSFSDIKFKKSEKCKNVSGSFDIKPDSVDSVDSTIRDLRDVSQELLGYHVKTTKKITEFLKKLFKMEHMGDGTWKVIGIDKNVLFGGFPVLNSYTDIARDLLTEYYSGCETIYQKGVEKWNSHKKDAAAAPVPVPVAGAPVAGAAAPVPVPVPVPVPAPAPVAGAAAGSAPP